MRAEGIGWRRWQAKDLEESVMGNGLDVPVYIESGPPVSVKRLSNGIPTYRLTNTFDIYESRWFFPSWNRQLSRLLHSLHVFALVVTESEDDDYGDGYRNLHNFRAT